MSSRTGGAGKADMAAAGRVHDLLRGMTTLLGLAAVAFGWSTPTCCCACTAARCSLTGQPSVCCAPSAATSALAVNGARKRCYTSQRCARKDQ